MDGLARSQFRLVISIAAIAVAMLATAQTASANQHDVTTTADTGSGSLRDAITAANADTTPPVVVKITATGTLTLGSALDAINNDMKIDGPGASKFTIDGANSFQIFSINSGKTVTIDGLTATKGSSSGGGAIVNNGTLTLDGVTVSHSNSSANGGGLQNNGGATATVQNGTFDQNTATNLGGGIENSGKLTVTGSTISTNNANLNATGTGAGIDVENNATLTMSDTTVKGNMTPGNGSGLRVEGTATVDSSTFTNNQAMGFAGAIGVTNQTFEGAGGNLTLRNSTVTDNTATANAGGVGVYGNATIISSTITSNSAATGANVNVTAGATFENTIVAYPQGPGGNCANSGSLTSNGNNLEDDMAKSCNFTQSTDQSGVDPHLATLADNGGPTMTRKPILPSPAVDKGTAAGLVADAQGHVFDQRGVIRPVGSQADIGAVELAPPIAVTGAAGPIAGRSATVTGLATNPHVAGGSAHFLYGTSSNPSTASASRAVPAGANNRSASVPLTGLLPNTTYHFKLVVTNQDGVSSGAVHTFKTLPTPPHASTGGAFNVKSKSAKVRGHVNPEGLATTFRFEYGTDTSYGHKTSAAPAGSGMKNLPVTAKITGLKPATTYHYRILAKNSNGSATGRDRTFTTKPGPPLIRHTHVITVGSDDAQLGTEIDPNGSSTSYSFEWEQTGPTGARFSGAQSTGRGQFFHDHPLRKSSSASGNAGSDSTFHPFTAFLQDLAPSTTYRFRVTAQNKAGSAQSPWKTFTTQSGENDTDHDD